MLDRMAGAFTPESAGRRSADGHGAGWLEREYRAYGYEFPPARVRLEQMVEALKLLRCMWTSSPATYDGTYYHIHEAFCEPRPDPLPLIMIGGDGERRTLRAVAEHADWWNTVMRPVDVLRHKLDVLRQHCRDVNRDETSVRKTLTRTVFLARTRAEAEARAGARLQEPTPPFAGDPSALIDHLHELIDLGFDAFQLVFADFPETTDLKLFMEKVLPHFETR